MGDITLEGTLAFATFGALPIALVSAALYLLAAPWLPRGRLAGPAFGLVLLVVGSPFVDPLRADNVDFDLLGPGWLSVAVFALLALLHDTALPRALPALLAARRSRRGALIGRVLLGAATIAAAPAFIGAVVSIATR